MENSKRQNNSAIGDPGEKIVVGVRVAAGNVEQFNKICKSALKEGMFPNSRYETYSLKNGPVFVQFFIKIQDANTVKNYADGNGLPTNTEELELVHEFDAEKFNAKCRELFDKGLFCLKEAEAFTSCVNGVPDSAISFKCMFGKYKKSNIIIPGKQVYN